ncbi:baseplate J/gp47 family protein [Pantoea sp. BAV 3049]|uniref:baseplate J/gp47 family protein n=1 Tax=Pantoea sp. BAV 3049 TaxID=2654188 RepID=UPI00131C2A39|nr:baseplate J/gp47 family protein [Pantoea sp. BAV 3049]
MADAYITDTGLDKPTLADCVQEIGDSLEGVVGPVNREADSTTGQWIGVEAEANSVHFEALEHLWNSRFLSSATGMALDAIGSWFGIEREGKTSTQVNAVVYGSESTQVPAGSLASFGNYQFTLASAATISRASLVDGVFQVLNNTQSAYTVRAAGVDYTYTKQDGDAQADIAAALSQLIEGSDQFTSTANGSRVYLTSENLIQGYPVSINAGLQWVTIGSPASFTASEAGSITVPAGGLNTPVSAITGWTGVNNLVDGSTGSERESDYNYRLRLKNSRGSVQGAATQSAISNRLLAVSGVTIARVIENDTMSTVNNIPAKSIHCIVSGGLEQDVANAIWTYKATAIGTYGAITLSVKDIFNNIQSVSFSRPEEEDIYVRVNVTLLDDEEVLPDAVITLIKEGVVNYFSTLSLGDDVITQRMYGYIYSKTTGLGRIEVTASQDGTNFSEDNIEIPYGGFASVTPDRVEVTGV